MFNIIFLMDFISQKKSFNIKYRPHPRPKIFYKANPEYHRKWRQKNPEKKRAIEKKYKKKYMKTAEFRRLNREYMRRYYAKNRDKWNAYMKEYQRLHIAS